MGGCLWLTILGGVLEGFGFGLVAWELWRVQHSEFGPPAWLMRLRAWVRRLLRRPTVVKLGGASVSGGGSMKARMPVRRSPGETLEERVAALEANFGHLEGELDERTQEADQHFRRIEQGQRELRADLDRTQRERDEQRKDFLRGSMKLQAWATGLFVFGVVLSVLGNAVTC